MERSRHRRSRTAIEPRAGHTTLSFIASVSGWRAGDRVFLPDTRQVPADHWFNPSYALQIEERIVQAVSPDGRTLTLASPLAFDHRGARDADGTPTMVSGDIQLLPHVGNLTRNVVLRSENPGGTRAHTLYTHRSTVSIHFAQFQDLGRTRAIPLDQATNHIGRYPLHLHHLIGPVNPANTGYQFQVVGNAITDSLKWPVAVHGSHFGLIKQNVVYGGPQLTGAGIAIEDGTETENLFEENLVANIRGSINPRESGPSTANGTTPGSAAECFWANGFNNRFVGNVASSCRNPVQQIVSGPGWKFIIPAAPYTARNPRFRGADMTNTAETVAVTPQHQPIREFRGNEVYGLAADGLTAWQLGTDGYGIMPATMGQSVIKDFRVWHTYEGAIYNYPSHRMTVDGLVYPVDAAATLYWPAAFQCGDYRNVDVTIRNGSVHAGAIFGGCTDPLGTYLIENVDATTRDHAFWFETPATPGTGADRPATGVTITLRNNRIRAWPGRPLQTIGMHHDLSRGNAQPNDRYEVIVEHYPGAGRKQLPGLFRGTGDRKPVRRHCPMPGYDDPARDRRDHVRPEPRAITANRTAHRPIKKSFGCGAAAEQGNLSPSRFPGNSFRRRVQMRYARTWAVVFALLLVAAPFTLAQAGVAGAWTLTFQTDQGAIDADMTLKQDGQKVTGSLVSPQGEAPIEGTFTDGKLLLSMSVDAQGQALVITFNGALEKDTLKGDVDFGGFGSAQWSATRQ
jgi:hypothetical protein